MQAAVEGTGKCSDQARRTAAAEQRPLHKDLLEQSRPGGKFFLLQREEDSSNKRMADQKIILERKQQGKQKLTTGDFMKINVSLYDFRLKKIKLLRFASKRPTSSAR